MSSGNFFASLKKLSGKHYIIISLLTVHTSWIVYHMNLVSQELINPWKLGGYGMYTKPANRASLRLYDIRSETEKLSKKTYTSKGFRSANYRYSFRCRPISEASLLIFLKDNPHLENVDLRFTIKEREFRRNPIRTKLINHSVTEIRWQQKDRFTYSGKVCGNEYTGIVDYKS